SGAGIRAGKREGLAHLSDLRGQLVEQRLVGVGIDFALEQLFGTDHSQRGYLLAQIFAGAIGGSVDFSLGQIFLTVGLGDGFVLGGFNDLVGTDMSLIDDFVGRATGVLQRLVDLFLRLGQIFLAAIGSGQAFSDLLLALFDS